MAHEELVRIQPPPERVKPRFCPRAPETFPFWGVQLGQHTSELA